MSRAQRWIDGERTQGRRLGEVAVGGEINGIDPRPTGRIGAVAAHRPRDIDALPVESRRGRVHRNNFQVGARRRDIGHRDRIRTGLIVVGVNELVGAAGLHEEVTRAVGR